MRGDWMGAEWLRTDGRQAGGPHPLTRHPHPVPCTPLPCTPTHCTPTSCPAHRSPAHPHTAPPPHALHTTPLHTHTLHVGTRRPGSTAVCVWRWVTGCPSAAENTGVRAASAWNEPRPWSSCPGTCVLLAVVGAEGPRGGPTRRWVTPLPSGHTQEWEQGCQPLQEVERPPALHLKHTPRLSPGLSPLAPPGLASGHC